MEVHSFPKDQGPRKEPIPEPEEREGPLGDPENPTNLSSGASPLWGRPHHIG